METHTASLNKSQSAIQMLTLSSPQSQQQRPRSYNLTLTHPNTNNFFNNCDPKHPLLKPSSSCPSGHTNFSSPLTKMAPSELQKPSSPYCPSVSYKPPIPKQQSSIDWSSLTLILLVTLVTESAKGLLMPSLLPNILRFNPSDSAFSLGTLTAAYALGRLLVSIPMGFLIDAFSPLSMLIITMLLQAVGHLLYCFSSNLFMLHVARSIVGAGSTATNLARTHIARCIPPEKRTTQYAYLCALQFAGTTLMPVFGSLIGQLPTVWSVSEYTYPPILLLVLNILCAILSYQSYSCIPYHEDEILQSKSIVKVEAKVRSYGSISNGNKNKPIQQSYLSFHINQIPTPNYFILITCLVVNVCVKSVTTIFEAVSVPFLHEHFSISPAFASVYVSCLGIFGMCTFLVLQPLSNIMSDRRLLCFGLYIVLLATCVLSMPSVTMKMNIFEYTSCIGAAWSIGTPIVQTATLALFSKALNGLSVGGFIGVFSATGSIAPLGAVIIATKLWSTYDRTAVFLAVLAIVTIAVIFVVVMYDQLKEEWKAEL